MQHRKGVSYPVLGAASAFFKRLNEAGIRYGVFKSSRSTAAALAGDQDLDILIAREDYHRFCAIAIEFAAIRSMNHRSLTSPGREDWFVPDFDQAKYLHLDLHVSVRLGGKFNKRYLFYTYGDIQCWNMTSFGSCSIPIVSARDEARITLSRIAFRSHRMSVGPWQKLTGDWRYELDELLFASTDASEQIVSYETGGAELQCRVKKAGGEIWVNRRDLDKIRRIVKARNAATSYSAFVDPIRNASRACAYFASRIINRAWPGSSIDRRQPTTGGIVVAVVAPDGMGKTTQVKRMNKLFGWKFDCIGVYLGTGDGEGWWIRRLIRAHYIRRRSRIKQTYLTDSVPAKERYSFKRRLGSYLLALWGLLVALERFTSVCKARRMAGRGIIVLCDRWPQSVQHGFLDGPTQQREDSPMTWLRKWELSLYDRMAQYHPDIAIQLIGDYAISEARKPGELTREEFDKRLNLMAEIRESAPNIHMLDAGGDIDDVASSIFKLIWSQL